MQNKYKILIPLQKYAKYSTGNNNGIWTNTLKNTTLVVKEHEYFCKYVIYDMVFFPKKMVTPFQKYAEYSTGNNNG